MRVHCPGGVCQKALVKTQNPRVRPPQHPQVLLGHHALRPPRELGASGPSSTCGCLHGFNMTTWQLYPQGERLSQGCEVALAASKAI